MIHPQAIVHTDCRLGDDVKVWQFASVLRRSRLGDGSSVGGCAVVDGARLGARAKIGHGAQVHPGVVAGADLFVGPGAIICNDPWPWLGSKDFDIDALIEGRAITVLIEDGVTIGAGAIVLPGIRLGAGCVVAAGVVARRDVPAGQIVLGGATKPVWGQRRSRMRLVA